MTTGTDTEAPEPRLFLPDCSLIMWPMHDHFSDDRNEYDHDPRCIGACYHCGGAHTPYPDTPELRCLYCEHGECPTCNMYLRHVAEEQGRVV